MPVVSSDHYCVYCINVIHRRIDILDSIDYDWGHTDPSFRHTPISVKIPIINAAFQKVTGRRFPDFSKWPRALVDVTKQAGPHDCMFFAWKYMEFYDGNALTIKLNPVRPSIPLFFHILCCLHFLLHCALFFCHV